MVPHILHNPVFNALSSGDARFSNGTETVKYFDEAVSPFVGFVDQYENGFEELYHLLPPSRKILFAKPNPIDIPNGWKLKASIEGLQFVYEGKHQQADTFRKPVPLSHANVDEMIRLATLTKPGPFNRHTIDFGSYHGFFEDGKLIAMAGQRLHVYNYTEISAVCTHPDYLGRKYATALLQHQLNVILNNGQIPFLHVRADNERAIAVYEHLGFKVSRPMHFYFLEKEFQNGFQRP